METKKREVLVKDLNCWFIKTKNRIDARCEKDVVLLVKKIKYSEFLKICKHYPMILIEDRLLTSHNTLFEGFAFFPPFEFAEEEVLYIKNEDVPEYVDVVLEVVDVLKEKDEISKKEIVNSSSKTYLMLSNSSYTKIGKSFNPLQREKTLQYENPTISLFAVCNQDVEKELHVKFSHKRYRGEWFNLSKNEINQIMKEYNFNSIKV